MARAIHVFRTPDRFVAGTVGQPGNRTFYLQAVHDSRVISVMLEKQQVAVLAERIAALLIEINRRFGTPLPPEADPEDLSPLITHQLPYQDFEKGFEVMKAGKSGKVVLDWAA